MSQYRSSSQNKTQYIAASKLAAMGYCETKLVLEMKHGEIVTQDQQAARTRGNKQHNQFHERAVQNHNSIPKPRTGPCFIASAVYGYHDDRTNELRQFRDQVLQPTIIGRCLIATYYRISPPLAAWITRHPDALVITRRVLDTIRTLIKPRMDTYEQQRTIP